MPKSSGPYLVLVGSCGPEATSSPTCPALSGKVFPTMERVLQYAMTLYQQNADPKIHVYSVDYVGLALARVEVMGTTPNEEERG